MCIRDRYAKSYLDWLGEKRDWPVSRQLWWGHQFLFWYEPDDAADLLKVCEAVCGIKDRYPNKVAIQMFRGLAPPSSGQELKYIGMLVSIGPDAPRAEAELEQLR